MPCALSLTLKHIFTAEAGIGACGLQVSAEWMMTGFEKTSTEVSFLNTHEHPYTN